MVGYHLFLLHAAHSEATASELIDWFGSYHLLFLHFPIACAILAGLAEGLYIWTKKEGYAFTAQFLLIATAIFSIPTVAAGLALAQKETLVLWNTLWWHRAFGFFALIFSFLSAVLRFFPKRRALYLISLVLLIISVAIAADLGGDMAFPNFRWLP